MHYFPLVAGSILRSLTALSESMTEDMRAYQNNRARGAVAAMSTVLVTGGSGYLGTRLISDLLASGVSVRTTVRSLDAETDLRAAVRRGGADDAGLELTVASDRRCGLVGRRLGRRRRLSPRVAHDPDG